MRLFALALLGAINANAQADFSSDYITFTATKSEVNLDEQLPNLNIPRQQKRDTNVEFSRFAALHNK